MEQPHTTDVAQRDAVLEEVANMFEDMHNHEHLAPGYAAQLVRNMKTIFTPFNTEEL